ncbi:hypothetical protein A3709_19990 [Halioglobus sp. HI00S01]|nr:hypothetical protein A3709_19990 [Halioglobus sp. HI00S01]
MASNAVYSVGLGQIVVSSALHEEFQGEIEILLGATESLDEVRIGLAPKSVYEKLDTDRPYYLTRFDFKKEIKEAGTPVVRITSQQKITEPLVVLVIEAIWKGGRIARQYTVMIDPP